MNDATESYTWAGLLAHWSTLAKVTMALPQGPEGDRWRAAVPAMIDLQAVTMALRDLDRLAEPAERPLALDRAALLIRRDAASLYQLWRGEPLHAELESLIADARAALEAAALSGLEWTVDAPVLIANHPADLVAALLGGGFEGDLYLPAPGIPLFPDCPAAFARAPDGGEINILQVKRISAFLADAAPPVRRDKPRLAYRQFDFSKGGPVRDLVVPIDASLPAGQPLLVPAIIAGEELPVSLPPRITLEQPPLPVIFEE